MLPEAAHQTCEKEKRVPEVEFASRVEEDAVWSQVAKAQLREGLVSDAIESVIRADDATQFLDVIRAAEIAGVYHDLVKYLLTESFLPLNSRLPGLEATD